MQAPHAYTVAEAFVELKLKAGKYKAVTIATNMAGRGTDIVLGGNAEFLTKNIVKAKGLELDSPEGKQEFDNRFCLDFCDRHFYRVVLGWGIVCCWNWGPIYCLIFSFRRGSSIQCCCVAGKEVMTRARALGFRLGIAFLLETGDSLSL